jgi:hypothetical protein
MNLDEFEQRLQSRPFKQVPGEWRAGILRAAEESRATPEAGGARNRGADWRVVVERARRMLFPGRLAWGALAAVWVIIGILRFGAREMPAPLVAGPPATRSGVRMAMTEHQRLLAELLGQSGPTSLKTAEPALPRPQSMRCRETFVV